MTDRPTRDSKPLAVIRVASGNFLEMYDFMVYAYYATYIAKNFFPAGSEFASLMLSLSTFGAGYLMRPVGALVLGAYIDRNGRRRGLMLTLGLMGVGTLTLAATPGYATIGLAAPVIVLLGRLLQGFSAGVELGGVSVYLAEIATPGHRGFYTAWQSASQQVAVMCAALFGVVLAATLPPEEMLAWGWRVPLAFGCLIVPLLLILRRSLQETEEFSRRPHHPAIGEVIATLARNWPVVLTGIGLTAMTTVSFYFITAYTPTFGTRALGLSARDALVVTLCVGFSNLVWLPVGGALSDRIGRRKMLIALSLVTLLAAYPVLAWLVAAPSFGRLLAAELFLSTIYGFYNGAMVAYLTELMPDSVRTTGFSIAYSLATAVGGFTPALSTWLGHAGGNDALPGLWLSFAAGCSLVAALVSSRLSARPADRAAADGVRPSAATPRA